MAGLLQAAQGVVKREDLVPVQAQVTPPPAAPAKKP
jgi:hypothetical protein